MNEFFKTIVLDFEADDSIKSVQKSLDALKFDPSFSKELNKQLDEYSKKQQVIAKLQKDIEVLRKVNTKEANEAAEKLQKELKDLTADEDKAKRTQSLQTSLKGMLMGVATSFLGQLKGVLSGALNELSSMTDFSKMTNAEVRELKLGYGFSSSQAYGYTQAMSAMGFSSMEDLMWADSQQLELFRKAFDKYTQYYEETMTPEYVAKQFEYQVAMKEFKMDLQNSVISFFMDHKDTIMKLMDFSMKFMEAVMTLLGSIVDGFSSRGRAESSRARETSSILNAYTSNARTTNVNQTNNFNNVSRQDQTWLQNSTQFAFKQVIEQLDRG